MAGYAGTKTWSVGDSWGASEPNTYIRDNFDSVRLFSHRPVFADGIRVNTTLTQYGVHSSVLPSTPAENYTMVVVMSFTFNGGSGSGVTWVKLQVCDDIGNPIGQNGGAADEYICDTVSGHTYGTGVTLIGSKAYSGVNCGVSAKIATNTGDLDVQWASVIMFDPA